MENKEKMVKYDGEEISEKLLLKIQRDAIEKDKKEMANWMKKKYQCSVCKISPRPGTKTVKKCTFCTKIFCDGCMSHNCPNKGKINTNSSVNIALTFTLDIMDKYMSYSCKNVKFGCEEMLANAAKLVGHEKNCDFQAIQCTEINCKTEVCYLKYLDHFEENHGNYENLGDAKVFKSPIGFDKLIQYVPVTYVKPVCSDANCKGTPNYASFRKCATCLKIYCCQGKSGAGANYKCETHLCYNGTGQRSYCHANSTDIGAGEKGENGKWLSKKFTAFNKTFFEVGIMRNNFIYKWIYVLALPDEAKNYYFHAYMKNANGENVLTYYDQVRSMVETHEKVIADGTCFSMAVQNAKRFVKEGTNQVDFSLKIRNLKDEAKDDEEESGIDD